MTLALRPSLEKWLAEAAQKAQMSRHGFVIALIERQRDSGTRLEQAYSSLPPQEAEAERIGAKANKMWRELMGGPAEEVF